MSLLLLFAYPNPLSLPVSELIETQPSATDGVEMQRPATSGDWRFVLELADPADGDAAIWRDITGWYAGDRYQRGADDYLGKYRAAIATVQLQIDDSDMLAPWGQDTSSLFGVDVRLDAGMLMRFTMTRIVAGVVAEWTPIWMGRVESWGDATEAGGQIRKHVVSVIDTIADLANVPTEIVSNIVPWPDWLSENLGRANWLFGVDYYGDTDDPAYLQDLDPVAAINRMDSGTEPAGLVWRSLRSGRLVVHPAPWDTTNTNRYVNPLLAVYPDGLRFSYFPDLTDIEYIQDDGEQSFGAPRNVAGILNAFYVTMPGDFGPVVYPIDDPVSAGRYGVRPFQATWISSNPQAVDDMLAARAYSSSQALPLRTSLDQGGFWPAMTLIDQFDPVTVVHATRPDGLVLTATGTVRNIVEERTYDGERGLSWRSTVQIDIDATETSPALLPVEDLALVATESPGLGGPSLAEFSWTNPVQPSITPTEVQMRVLGRSTVWFSKEYPGVGGDGTVIGFLSAATHYTFQVRLIRRVNGVIVAYSVEKSLEFTTPANIVPVPVPDGDDTDAEIPEPPDFDDDCVLEVELQENDGSGWVTVDEFDGAELTDNGNGTWRLTTPIPNSFFNVGSMYRFQSREVCGGIPGPWYIGPAFDPPDDWTDPCTTPPAVSMPPWDDADLSVYVPQICAPDIIREYVSGIAGVHGDALAEILALVTDPNQRALSAIAEPFWSSVPAGILAYGECPQIVGNVGDVTIAIRVNVAVNESVVLGECAAMLLTAGPGAGSDWVAGATINTVAGVLSLVSGDLPADTPTDIKATYESEGGTFTLYVDGAEVDSDTFGAEANRINTLPIWRVGAPPESWITDFALWNRVLAPVFTPGDVAGLLAWYDASDTSTIVSSGSEVTQWADKSASGFDLTRPVATNGPNTGTRTKNGLNVLDFGPVTGLGNVAFVHLIYSMFVVFVEDTTPGSPFVSTVSMFRGTEEHGIRTVNTASDFVVVSGSEVRLTGSAYANGSWRQVFGSIAAGPGLGMTLRQNATPVATGNAANGPNAADTFTVGIRSGGRPLDGAIAEIVIYDSVLNPTDRGLVETYLAAKWAV